MLWRILLLTVCILLAVVWPAQAQSPPLTLLQPGSGIGINLDGSTADFSVTWALPVWEGVHFDALAADGQAATGLSAELLWAANKCKWHPTGFFEALLTPLSGGAYLWSEAHAKRVGGLYLRANLITADF